MNGHIIPGTPIAVDFWKKRECPSAKFFFLTHLHGDHTVGLSSSWQYNIYCSEITAKLLINRFSVKESLVIPLEMDRSHIIYMDEEKQEQLVVNLIDANHCPGSVMFLFEGYFGKVLYTGDFRFCEEMFLETPLSDSSNIDMLYLDNTYCAPECNFPTREEAIGKIIELIRKRDDCRIIIGMRQLGKEQLLVRIAQEFQEWISVSSSMFKTAEILGLPNIFCIDDIECKIRVVPFHTVTRSNVLDWNDFEPTLAILPTCLYVGLGSTPYADCPNIHIIPYSDHSSYNEICKFVQHVKPKCIHPIVNERKRSGIFGQLADRADMSCLSKYLSKEESVKFSIPASVKKFMALPMNTYLRKISHQKRRRSKGHCYKKPQSTSLGVVFQSPAKSEFNDSCNEFVKLNEMKNSFKNTKQKKDKEKVGDDNPNQVQKNSEKQILDSKNGENEENQQKLQQKVPEREILDNHIHVELRIGKFIDNKLQETSMSTENELLDNKKELTNDKQQNQEYDIQNDVKYLEPEIELENISPVQGKLHAGHKNSKNINNTSLEGDIVSSTVHDNCFLRSEKEPKVCDSIDGKDLSPVNSTLNIPSVRNQEKNVKGKRYTYYNVENEKIQDKGFINRQDELDYIGKTGSETVFGHFKAASSKHCKENSSVQPSNNSSALTLLYDKTISASTKVKLIALKPLTFNRSSSVPSDLCIYPLTNKSTRKRRHSGGEEQSVFKKSRR